MRLWQWLVGAVLVLGTGAVIVLYFMTGKSKVIKDVALNTIEAAHAPKIRELTDKISDMRRNLGKNLDAIADAEEEVEKRKDDIRMVHSALGLTAEEQLQRFAEMRI